MNKTSYSHLLSYFCSISSRKNVQIRQQSTGLQHTMVPRLHLLSPKCDVVLDCGVLDPGLLRHVGHRTLWRSQSRDRQYFVKIKATNRRRFLLIKHRLSTLTTTRPLLFSVSPSMADNREDFPLPTCPTTATREPRGTRTLILSTKM